MVCWARNVNTPQARVTHINSSNGHHACRHICKSSCQGSGLRFWTLVWKQALCQVPPSCHTGTESGAVLFSAHLSVIFTLGRPTRSWLAGYQCGLTCLACEVTLCVYFGFVLILSSQHCLSHWGKGKHSFHLLVPPSLCTSFLVYN